MRLQEVAKALLGKSDSDVSLVLEDRSLDESWIVDHRSKGLGAIHIVAVDFRDFSPGQASFVQQRFPTDAVCPALQHLYVYAVLTYVMKLVLNALVREIISRFPAGVAAVYSVNR